MKTTSIYILALVAAANASILKPRAVCNADLCLRAVRATQRPTVGPSDCSEYFRVTVTPSTSTFYDTTTLYISSTTTPDTVTDTATTSITATETIPTTTVTITTITTPGETTVPFTATVTELKKVKRDATIPAYASACSGVVRYSSACSCLIGTFPTTTVAAPSTTITLPTTITTYDSFPTVTNTVTLTNTISESTTEISTTTATAFVPDTTWVSFRAKVKSGPKQGEYLVQKNSLLGDEGPYFIGLNPVGSIFLLNQATGEIKFGEVPRGVFVLPGQTSVAFVLSMSDVQKTRYGAVQVTCSISGNDLSCGTGSLVQTGYGDEGQGSSFYLGASDLDWSAYGGEAATYELESATL
ncbi:hypothetical protein H072_2428 [Dactylellina haptotyla CBS 200.50]|uniref:PA14 domain-containing protein n=1 Tax=Dactylellina haptotyla (strain CBS 200.50) TaxID=1284197 RepID=S8BVW6_DACHA|nr:hypothetical protein H072_2428 [Dactylellina haptotyla CBS 200.50]